MAPLNIQDYNIPIEDVTKIYDIMYNPESPQKL